jgi:hypothetical protein
VLPHITWPVVVLAVVLLFRLAVKRRETWWRLIFGIVVLVVVGMGAVVVGVQLHDFTVPALPRTPMPAVTASPRPAPPVTTSPVAAASPSHSAVYPGGNGRGARSVHRHGRTAAPRPTRPARVRPGSPATRVRAGRDTSRRPRADGRRDMRPLRPAPRWSVTLRAWPRAPFPPFRWYRTDRCRVGW